MPEFFTIGFRADENDDLYPTFAPAQFSSEADAIAAAVGLSSSHIGVLSWSQPSTVGCDDAPHMLLLYRQGRIRSPFGEAGYGRSAAGLFGSPQQTG